MKTTLLLLVLFLTSCSTQVTQPTPFKTGTQHVTVYGCEQLKQDVEKYNKANNGLLVADC